GYTPAKAVMSGDTIVVPQGAKAIFVDKVKDGPKGFAVWARWDDHTASFERVPRPGQADRAASTGELDPTWKSAPASRGLLDTAPTTSSRAALNDDGPDPDAPRFKGEGDPT